VRTHMYELCVRHTLTSYILGALGRRPWFPAFAAAVGFR
jgi:hypothetical protein